MLVTRLRLGIPSAMIVAAMALLLAIQHQTALELREEHFALQQQVDQLSSLAAEHDRRSKKMARAKNSSSTSNELLVELLRLRGEGGARKKEIQKLRTALGANSTTPAVKTAPGPAATDDLPKESWMFAGYATPEAALQSTVWAASHGDLKAILASSTPEEANRMAEEWQGKSESEIAAESIGQLSRVTGFQIVNTRADLR